MTFAVGRMFSQSLRRNTSLNHLAQAARAVLENPQQVKAVFRHTLCELSPSGDTQFHTRLHLAQACWAHVAEKRVFCCTEPGLDPLKSLR